MKTKLFSFLVLMLTCFAATAENMVYWLDSNQYNQWTDSPNFAKARILFNEEDNEAHKLAIAELEEEIAVHPGNGYAQCNRAITTIILYIIDVSETGKENIDSIKSQLKGTAGKALDWLEKGRNLIPEADKENRAYSWIFTAMFYRFVDEENTAPIIEALEKSVEFYPMDDIYDILIEMTWNPDDMSIAEKYAQLALEKNPNNPTALKTIMNVCKVNKDYESFLKYYDKYMESCDEELSEVDFKLTHAIALATTQGKDAAINYLFNDYENNYYILEEAMLSINADPETVLFNIGQREFAEEGDPDFWNMFKGNIYSKQLHNYKEALNCYNKISSNYESNELNKNLTNCYYMTGDINNALIHAQALDYLTASDDLMNLQLNLGMLDPIISNLTSKLDLEEYLEPSVFDYNTLGLCFLLKKDYQQAANTLNKALLLNEKNPETLLYLGKTLKALGRDSEANQFLEKTFEANYNEETASEEVIQSQASILLGRTIEGRQILEKMEKNWQDNHNSHETGNATNSKVTCYDIAATYAMLGDYGKIQEWMQRHFECDDMPYNFGFMSLDSRLDNVKDVPMLKQLVDKYYLQWKNNK